MLDYNKHCTPPIESKLLMVLEVFKLVYSEMNVGQWYAGMYSMYTTVKVRNLAG